MDLKSFWSRVLPGTDPEILAKLAKISSIRHLRRKEITVKLGQMQTHFYFLIHGVIRCYFYTNDGTEVTDCFITEPGYPVMMAALTAPSMISAQAVVDSELISVPIEAGMELIKSSNELLWWYNQVLHQALYFHWKIKTSRYCYDAAQRYQWFCQTWPGVDEVANGSHIASFLGITPATLSRLRHAAKQEPEPTQMLADPYSNWNGDRVEETLRSRRQDGNVGTPLPKPDR
jgi:CRP-like cAMP-binding protein